MPKYIDLEKLMAFPIRINHYDEEHGNMHFVLGIECVLECAQDLPTVDVEPVVRCRDCKNYSGKYCTLTDDSEDRREPDDYCSYGVRKDGE